MARTWARRLTFRRKCRRQNNRRHLFLWPTARAHWNTRCITCEYFFHNHILIYLNAAGLSHKRPRSLRPRSTRHDVFRPFFFIREQFHRINARSSARFLPLLLVPAMGRNSHSSSSLRTMTSGDEPIKVRSSSLRKNK